MKAKYCMIFLALGLLYACTTKVSKPAGDLHLNGTWQLISGTEISGGIKTVTDYTKKQQMIKIINDTHFAFLKHNLVTNKDSTNHFDAGGGTFTLNGNQYTEHLDYYANKNIEGNTFTFTVSIKNDTLIQQGIEKLKSGGAEKTIYEKYIRLK
ncbi:hypothetical protein [Pedobacter sp. L105]|uniref:hypothetical protein n=1 Tax=Pedobacter sp. L105 TaxID=1641871 RepID=UPI00131BEE8D|nr:hypothetical protein [Pedobacter sp. L105]